jgi:predicted TIM-barrel fold metal-dependent hydrolase
MLANDELEWLWISADEASVPVMVFAPEQVAKLGQIAERHPALRMIADHMGLKPHGIYEDLVEPTAPLLPLAVHPNMAVKATSLPSSVPGPYPFVAAHEAVQRVVDAFGPDRVFWGSDITRLPCTYRQCVSMFTEEMPFLSDEDKRLVMGRAVCEFLDWPIG